MSKSTRQPPQPRSEALETGLEQRDLLIWLKGPHLYRLGAFEVIHHQKGHTPSTAGTFRKKFRKNSGKTPETLSELFLEFPSRVRLGCPKRYNSRHLKAPEHFQNSLPPSTAGDASFFRSGSGEDLLELVMEFPAVLEVFLTKLST